MSYVMGIDTSTTATKALLVDREGAVVAVGVAEYPYETPKPLWSEQDPELWWDGTVTAVRDCIQRAAVDEDTIEAVGVTGQMHGLVLLDGAGDPLRKAILWNDQRTAAECDELRARVGRDRLIAISGNDALTGFTASKIMWVGNHEPETLAAAKTLLLPKDFVRHRLSGQIATDKAGGSGTQLFDLAARDWSAEIAAAVGIDSALLPTSLEGESIAGRVDASAAALTGLAAGTPIAAGGGDQAASAVGTGAIDPGEMTLSLGTSGVVFAATDEPTTEPQGRVHAFCHAVADRWHMMGVMLSAAGSLRWLRDAIAPGADFGQLSAEAAAVPPGSEGLLFLPYLSGERTPHPDPLARGAFIGLTVRHGRGHLVRAVMEGVAFGLRDGYELIKQAGVDVPARILSSGGGTKSELWRQIIADVLGTPLVGVATEEGAAFGAAVLAGSAAGWKDSAAALAREWTRTTVTTPPSAASYDDTYAIYREQYDLLAPTFARLGDQPP